jgi:CRP-like cAMP-binding protein
VLDELAARVATAAYGRGEPIVREGDDGGELYVIDRGEVSVRVEAAGSPHEIARLGPGDFFGEMSLMTGEPRRAAVVALGDVEAVRVDRESFREVLARNPKVIEEIGRVLHERAHALQEDAAANPREAQETAENRSRALVDVIRGFFRL